MGCLNISKTQTWVQLPPSNSKISVLITSNLVFFQVESLEILPCLSYLLISQLPLSKEYLAPPYPNARAIRGLAGSSHALESEHLHFSRKMNFEGTDRITFWSSKHCRHVILLLLTFIHIRTKYTYLIHCCLQASKLHATILVMWWLIIVCASNQRWASLNFTTLEMWRHLQIPLVEMVAESKQSNGFKF